MSGLPRLYAIVDAGLAEESGWTPCDLARAYLDGGARFLQLRAVGVSSGTQFDWCQEIVRLAHSVGAQVIVNDRCDLAVMSGAAGVHLGQSDLPIERARSILGPTSCIGLSTHNVDQAKAAAGEELSYVAIGPVYETSTKEVGYTAVGLEAVGRISEVTGPRPVVAIGGITLASVPALIMAGASAVAVASDLLAGGDPERRVRDYITELS